MTKIMVVEDDQSLREIYSIRLTAEGFDVVSAGDGEEALAIAVKEKPDLIVSDVMMPKISGFDMLDILRSTPETKDVKVIMMTALSSDDQRKRGESLGADRYLVKSQVGIEDVINSVKEVLSGKSAGSATVANATTVPTGAGVGAEAGAGTSETNMAVDLKNGPQFNPNVMNQPNPAVPTQPVTPTVVAPAPTAPVAQPTQPAPVSPVQPTVQPQAPVAPAPTQPVNPAPVTPEAPVAAQPAPVTPETPVTQPAPVTEPVVPAAPVTPTDRVQNGTNPAQ